MLIERRLCEQTTITEYYYTLSHNIGDYIFKLLGDDQFSDLLVKIQKKFTGSSFSKENVYWFFKSNIKLNIFLLEM